MDVEIYIDPKNTYTHSNLSRQKEHGAMWLKVSHFMSVFIGILKNLLGVNV